MSLAYPRVLVNGEYVRTLHPFDCKVSLSLQPLSTVNMTLPPTDEIANFDWVEIHTPDGQIGYYRVGGISTDTQTGEKSVYLEHGACTLNDILIIDTNKRKTLSYKTTISAILTSLLAGQSRWTVGTVESTDTIYIEPGGFSIMTAILTMMDSIPDYQLEFVQASQSDWHIDIKQRSRVPVCEGRLSRNLVSCDVDYSTDSICTRVYSDVLTGGKMDSQNISLYGIHEQTLSINEGLDQTQKNRIAQSFLDAHDHPAVSVSISGIELSQITGLTIDQFKLGTVCRIAIPWLGIVENEVIVEKSYSDPYGEPENVSFSLANATPDLSLMVAAITGGGGGGGGIGSAGAGGLEGKKNRFETKFEKTNEYLRLIATDTEYDELENGTLTAYGQLVITSTSFQTVVSKIGKDGTITAASIVLAINNDEGATIKLSADTIDIDGIVTSLKSKNIECGKFHAEGEITTLKSIYAEDFIHTDESLSCAKGIKVGTVKTNATWQSKKVVTGVSITFPSYTRSNDRYFVTATNGDTTKLATYYGSIITGKSDGSKTISTDTIYYLGRSGE